MTGRAAPRILIWILLVFGMAAGTPSATAHTELTGSDPAADSSVGSGPSRVTATFNEDLQPAFASMTVVGPDGNLWSAADAAVRGATVSVPVRPLGPAGRYTVNYRVTSADGHPVSGSWAFTVTQPGAGQPGPAAQTPARRIPLWPFVVGASLVIATAAAWGLRRRT